MEILLTANSGIILGPIAKFFGWIMNGIYVLMYNLFGIESVVLSIILLTIIIYMCMLPLTIQQQKFSKLSQKMQPELQAVQNKYKDKKDQASAQMMQQETQMIYQKYGVNPMGSCLQLLIQMPILFALYRVFYNVPAYISAVKNTYSGLAEGIASTSGFESILENIMSANNIVTGSGVKASNVVDMLSNSDGSTLTNYIIDILYKVPSTVWGSLSDSFPTLASQFADASAHIQKFNYFIGLNISDTPMSIIKYYFGLHKFGFVILALMIPLFSYLTQVLSMKLMPQSENQNDQMAKQMKTMNTMMPLMSLIICFTVPVGLGIYWIMSALVRVVQQFFINKHIANLDLDQIIAKNQEKAKAAMEKKGIYENQIREAAQIKTRSIESRANSSSKVNEEAIANAAEKKANAKPGSMAAKANMVKTFNEKNSRK